MPKGEHSELLRSVSEPQKRRLVTIDVVVVDFGGSVSTTSWAYSMVGTSAYRPPEVTLGEELIRQCFNVH